MANCSTGNFERMPGRARVVLLVCGWLALVVGCADSTPRIEMPRNPSDGPTGEILFPAPNDPQGEESRQDGHPDASPTAR